VRCEIWALDPEAGEAILREVDLWYLSAMDRKWKPVELDSPQGILEWSLSRAVVPVGRRYATRDEAVIVARQVCRTAWQAGMTSPDEIDRLLDEVEAERGRRREEDPVEWARRFPEILRAALELDRYFQAQGCTVEESLEWSCRTLKKLQDSGDWPRPGRELDLVLRRLAGSVQREARGRPEKPNSPERRLSDYERKRLAKDLDRLPVEELEILTCWANSGHSEEEIATLLHVAPGEVQQALGSVFRVGPLPEAWRNAAFAEVCKEALRRRV
jgi:hypothetical protein